jgi:hypothetical protein
MTWLEVHLTEKKRKKPSPKRSVLSQSLRLFTLSGASRIDIVHTRRRSLEESKSPKMNAFCQLLSLRSGSQFFLLKIKLFGSSRTCCDYLSLRLIHSVRLLSDGESARSEQNTHKMRTGMQVARWAGESSSEESLRCVMRRLGDLLGVTQLASAPEVSEIKRN